MLAPGMTLEATLLKTPSFGQPASEKLPLPPLPLSKHEDQYLTIAVLLVTSHV